MTVAPQFSFTDDVSDGFAPHPPASDRQYRAAGIFGDQPLWALLDKAVAAAPDAPAFSEMHADGRRRTLTYQEFQHAVLRRAAGFVADGLTAGQRVVVQQHNSIELAVNIFATLRARLVPVLTLPAHRISEITHLAAKSGAVAYLGDDEQRGFDYRGLAAELVDAVDSVRRVYINGDPGRFDRLPDAAARTPLPSAANPDSPALFLVSGGTTGLPKLIARTHNDYEFNARRSAEIAELGADDVYLAVLPAAHNFPLCCPGLLGMVSVGGHTVLTGDPAPDSAFDVIEEFGVTVTALVPALAQTWGAAAQWEPADVSTLRLLQVGGAKLARADAETLDRAFPDAVQQVFGMAEGLICYTRLDDDRSVVHGAQGIPMSEHDEVRIVDDAGNEVPDGANGELLTRGPYTIRGYYRADEHNAQSFTPDGFYRSGDVVRRLPTGHLVVTGRIKDTIVRAGENVAADDIEDLLLHHPAIAQAAIVGLPDDMLGESICAAIVAAPDAEAADLTLARVREYLTAGGLAAFKTPDRVALVAALPVTAVGKIDKRALAQSLS